VTFLNPDFTPKASQTSDIANTHLYTGRERDPETGLQWNRWRIYLSHLGRWNRRDREYLDSYNLYEYVASRPIGQLDPSGTTRFDDTNCSKAEPTSDISLCIRHRGQMLWGFDAECVCQCAGSSPWDNSVRGCLACAIGSGVPEAEAHARCYELADKKHGPWAGRLQRLDIGINCRRCIKCPDGKLYGSPIYYPWNQLEPIQR
jgi:RHS repeat-associated protein